MSESPESFSSSDDVRGAGPLRHAQILEIPGPHQLSGGGELPVIRIAFETYGTLNAERSNAVLVCHALSGDSHVARHDETDQPGWWEHMIGPGKSIDTDRFFVICPNVLGGCRGSTGPTDIDPETGRQRGPDFPAVAIDDIARAHVMLLDRLEIDRLHAAVGGSLGGHQVMTLSTLAPDRVDLCVSIASSPRLTAQSLAFDVVARNAILRDPNYHQGRYAEHDTAPNVGLAIARMLGHITYLSPHAMEAKFDPDRLRPREVETGFEQEFSVGSYLAYQGDKFVDRFDANSYLVISRAMDRFDLGGTPELLSETLAQSNCDWLVISFSSDWLFTPGQSRDIVDALTRRGRRVTYCEVPTEAGHDAFLLEPEIERYGPLVHAKLSRHDKSAEPQASSAGADRDDHDSASIFSDSRLDYESIVSLIAEGSSVLDVGCGPGGLLAELRSRGFEDLQGIDVDEANIVATARKSLSVIDHDLNRGLDLFPNGRFDVCVLSQTLQAVVEVEKVIREMLRVGQQAIVAFPNFGYAPLRQMLAEQGRSPKAEGSFGFEWYDSPNRRFPTIVDFTEFCELKGIAIKDAVYLDLQKRQRIYEDPNLLADTAIFVLTRR